MSPEEFVSQTIVSQNIVGSLLQRASTDPLTKSVITAFDPSASRSGNVAALNSSKFKVESLESCAAFLSVTLSDADSNKIFTKATLSARIVSELIALLPSTCTACNEDYTVEFDTPPPLFTCYKCFQGSHSCDAMTKKHQALKDAGLTDGLVWLCKSCLDYTNPTPVRKSKSRHVSVNSSNVQSRQASPSPSRRSPSPPRSPSRNSKAAPVEDKKDDSTPICERYRVGKCPHGLRGNKLIGGQKCSKKHPKKCFKHIKFGSKSKKGCKKGEKCNYFHPVLCKFSVRDGQCTNRECTYPHLVGTKRDKKKVTKQRKQDPIDIAKGPAVKKHDSVKYTENHFLEVQKLMEKMSSFQDDLLLIKNKLFHQQQPSLHPMSQTMYHPPRSQTFHPLQFSTPHFSS